ncbi:MAG TPA: Maf family protein [Candidatus Eisenbacteria bacterium]|jgi:septum formation protein
MRPNLLNPLGPRLLLVSRSARRAELLRLVGAQFDLAAVDVDERVTPGERPEAHVLRLAEAKARAGLAATPPQDGLVALGADTIVAIDRRILGKPCDAEDARRMLRALSGRVHEVWTGVAVVDAADGRGVSEAARSLVKFAPLEEDVIDRYVETGEPLDKAGGYAVQGYGALFVEAIEGSYSNVVGLPLSHVKHLLTLLRGAPSRRG